MYRKNGTVYIAGRTKSKYDAAEKDIKGSLPNSKGRLEFLQLDLADLSTIKASAEEFISQEQRLDVLTNNAGVVSPLPPSTLLQSTPTHLSRPRCSPQQAPKPPKTTN